MERNVVPLKGRLGYGKDVALHVAYSGAQSADRGLISQGDRRPGRGADRGPRAQWT